VGHFPHANRQRRTAGQQRRLDLHRLAPAGPTVTGAISARISGVKSQRAKPGDTIILYGIGFGSVKPTIPAGQLAEMQSELAESFTVSFDGKQATIPYDGLAPNFVGLYQFNVVVPQIAPSDRVPVTFTLGGTSGTQTLYTAVQ